MTDTIDINRPRQTRSFATPATYHFNSDSSRKRRKFATEPRQSTAGSRQSLRADAGYATLSTPAPASASLPRRRPYETSTPTYSSAAAAAAAAAVQVDNYKPREERSWEDFHPDLDIDNPLAAFSAQEVDGPRINSGVGSPNSNSVNGENVVVVPVPIKRGPGRPPRRPEAWIPGFGYPSNIKIAPTPAQNPKERLNLPKPSFRKKDNFQAFEQNDGQSGYHIVDEMVRAGYQRRQPFEHSAGDVIRYLESPSDESLPPATRTPTKSSGTLTNSVTEAVSQVEYDMDEQDEQWLEDLNSVRQDKGSSTIHPGLFEITMTHIEQEWYKLEKRIPKPNPKPPQTQRPRSSSAAAVSGEPAGQGEEQDSKCAICDDGDCENTNAIVFCDGCDLAVHQECYGVPFIPEGQWLCRKCQFLGRGIPTCIFCPNTDGAFKLTHESKWAHLLCSIWIPEVSLGNLTFMEPIMEVAKVPRSRWKLHCYICNQRMGACIQCSNKNCYQAFHVTCARRAKLFLRTKSAQGGPPILDNNILKAYCDKHVTPEWQQEHNTAQATIDTKWYYKRAMRGRRWADSQSSALSLISFQQQYEPSDPVQRNNAEITTMTAAQKKKQLEARKSVWRLPSGAPIVPEAILEAVQSAMQHFDVTDASQYIHEACKYWTLKREARRGATLLKRLQFQMDTFSSAEIARRDFVGMGAAGGPKLQRRIEFTDNLLRDMEEIQKLCAQVQAREAQKLRDAHCLRDIVETVYFPISAIISTVLQKFIALDVDLHFAEVVSTMRRKLDSLQYASVASFMIDLRDGLSRAVAQSSGRNSVPNSQNNPLAEDDGNGPHVNSNVLKHACREIISSLHEPLQLAIQAEAELDGRVSNEELNRIERYLQESIELNSDEASLMESTAASADAVRTSAQSFHVDETADRAQDDSAKDVHATSNGTRVMDTPADTASVSPHSLHQDDIENVTADEVDVKAQHYDHVEYHVKIHNEGQTEGPVSMPTPPNSEKDKDGNVIPPATGGVAWYLREFEPDGTSVIDHEVNEAEHVEHSDSGPTDAHVEADVTAEPQKHEEEEAIPSKPVTPRKQGRARRRTRY